MNKTFLAKVSLWRGVAQGVAPGHSGASPLALPACSCGQDSASSTLSQCLAASCISKTDQKPKAAHPPHSPAQERNWGWQRNVNQARGLIHPPTPARCIPGSLSTAFCVLQSSPAHACLSSFASPDSPEPPRAEAVINQAAASIQDTHSLGCCAEK